MALPDGDNLGHRLIQDELANSSMTATKSSLRNMFDYVFGDETENMREFAGLGIPIFNPTSLSASGIESGMELTFTITETGLDSAIIKSSVVSVVANYWVDGNKAGTEQATKFTEVTGTGTFTRDLTGLDGGVTYKVRLYAYNLFNNAGNFPFDPNEPDYFDYCYNTNGNPASATTIEPPPEQPATPTFVRTWWISGNDFGIDFNFDNKSHPDDFDAEFKHITSDSVNNFTPSAPYSTTNWGTTNEPKSMEWDVANMAVPGQGSEVEVRIRSYDDVEQLYSDWSQWVSAGFCAPENIDATADGEDVTASWTNPSNYSMTESLSDSINPVYQWSINGSWQTEQSLANGTTSVTDTFSAGDTIKIRVTYDTPKGKTSEMYESNEVSLSQPFNLTFREEANNTLYAEWENEDSRTPIEYQQRNDSGTGTMEDWGTTQTLTAGTTEEQMGGNIPSGYTFQFRVRYEGNTTWTTSGTYTI